MIGQIKVDGIKGAIVLEKIENGFAYIKWYNDPVEAFPLQKDNSVALYGLKFYLNDFKKEDK